MIISTSSVGMESVRRYSSLRMDAYGLSGSQTVSPNDKLTVNESNSNKDASAAADSFQNSMDNLMKRFETMGTSRITHNHEEESAISRIKTQCIIYLLRLLFGRETDIDDEYDEEGYVKLGRSDPNVTSVSSLLGSFNVTGYEAHYYS